ncbi:flavin reductase family protein [Virgibacillus doumboii]|uniref:flavin reductase family protein n=1 Tax=Virgibacillus doumboii TaxID=2697503 RepID=UPI0013E09318|nr:flavin reductase family protein [Virgibacillus doumboii]
MKIELNQLNDQEKYKLLIGSVVPRPIAFVSTAGDGGTNVSPFSFFTVVSKDPMMLGFTTMPGPNGNKDTLHNIKVQKEYVVNIVSSDFLDQVVQSSATLAPGESEFDLTGLTPVKSELVRAPRVKESKVSFECKLHEVYQHGKGPESFIVGEVIAMNVADEVLMDQLRIDTEALQPIGRMAGNFYVNCSETFKVDRPR